MTAPKPLTKDELDQITGHVRPQKIKERKIKEEIVTDSKDGSKWVLKEWVITDENGKKGKHATLTRFEE